MFPTRIAAWACGSVVLMLSGAAQAQQDPSPSLTNLQRTSAARKTANTNPLCAKSVLGPYYWEVGDRNGMLASGSVGKNADGTKVTADTVFNIASASKWLYAAYVVEKRGVQEVDLPYLTMTSGYSNFRSTMCPLDQTVADCHPGAVNVTEATNHQFHYDGGHMQRNAVDNNLGPLVNATLAAEIQSQLGTDVPVAYSKPMMAGGVMMSANGYAQFLRKLLAGYPKPLKIAEVLGTNLVCTFPSATCNATDPAPLPEAWHYSLGHWYEDDPAGTPASNFAYSSTGSFGFYPWVDSQKQYYGVLSRQSDSQLTVNDGYASVQCGRLIRLAWSTGIPQTE